MVKKKGKKTELKLYGSAWKYKIKTVQFMSQIQLLSVLTGNLDTE